MIYKIIVIQNSTIHFLKTKTEKKKLSKLVIRGSSKKNDRILPRAMGLSFTYNAETHNCTKEIFQFE